MVAGGKGLARLGEGWSCWRWDWIAVSTGDRGGAVGVVEPSLLTEVEDLLKEGLRVILSLTLPKKDRLTPDIVDVVFVLLRWLWLLLLVLLRVSPLVLPLVLLLVLLLLSSLL